MQKEMQNEKVCECGFVSSEYRITIDSRTMQGLGVLTPVLLKIHI